MNRLVYKCRTVAGRQIRFRWDILDILIFEIWRSEMTPTVVKVKGTPPCHLERRAEVLACPLYC